MQSHTNTGNDQVKKIMDEYENIKNNKVGLDALKDFNENSAKIQIIYLEKLISEFKDFEKNNSNPNYQKSNLARDIRDAINSWETIKRNTYQDEFELMTAVIREPSLNDFKLNDIKLDLEVDEKKLLDIADEKIRKELEELISTKEKEIKKEIKIERKPIIARKNAELTTLIDKINKATNGDANKTQERLRKLKMGLNQNLISVKQGEALFNEIIKRGEQEQNIKTEAGIEKPVEVNKSSFSVKEETRILKKINDLNNDVNTQAESKEKLTALANELNENKISTWNAFIKLNNIVDEINLPRNKAIDTTKKVEDMHAPKMPQREVNVPVDAVVKKKDKKSLSTYLKRIKKAAKKIKIPKITKKKKPIDILLEKDIDAVSENFFTTKKQAQQEFHNLNQYFTENPSKLDMLIEVPKQDILGPIRYGRRDGKDFKGETVYLHIDTMRNLLNRFKQMREEIKDEKSIKYLDDFIKTQTEIINGLEVQTRLLIESRIRLRRDKSLKEEQKQSMKSEDTSSESESSEISEEESQHEDEAPPVIVENKQAQKGPEQDQTITIEAGMTDQVRQIVADIELQREKLDKWQHVLKQENSQHKNDLINHVETVYKKEYALHQQFIENHNQNTNEYIKTAENFLTNPQSYSKDEVLKLIEIAKKFDIYEDNTSLLKKDVYNLNQLKGILLGLQSNINASNKDDKNIQDLKQVQELLTYVTELQLKITRAYEVMAYCYHPQYIKEAKECHELAKESLTNLLDRASDFQKKYSHALPRSQSEDAHLQEMRALSREGILSHESHKRLDATEKDKKDQGETPFKKGAD